MKQYHRLTLATCAALTIAFLAWTNPAIAAQSRQAGGTVAASAVVVPVQASEMGFLLSAPVKTVAVKEGDPVKAGQTLIVLNTPELIYAVTEAEAALKSAQAEAQLQRYTHKTWNGSKFISLSGPPELRQIADDKVTQAQAALTIAQATLAQGTLVAPYDGVVAKINVAQGEHVQPGQVAIVIGTLDQLQVETTDLSERDITKIAFGQSATISVEALGQEFNGKVVGISPMADTVGGDVVYKVTLEFDEQPPNLLWGMSAEVQIDTQ